MLSYQCMNEVQPRAESIHKVILTPCSGSSLFPINHVYRVKIDGVVQGVLPASDASSQYPNAIISSSHWICDQCHAQIMKAIAESNSRESH